MNSPIETRTGNALQPRMMLPVRTDPAAPPPPPEDRLDLRAIYYALRRQRNCILVTVGVFVVAAAGITALQRPQYTASSQIVLNTTDETVAPRRNGDAAGAAPVSDVVDTQVEVIRSRELALSVAHALKLDRTPEAPAPEGWRHRIERAVGLGGAPEAAQADPDGVQRAIVNKLLGDLTVQRVGTTYAFNISVTSDSAHDAQAIANEYANQYTQLDLNRKRANGSTAAAFLADRLDNLRKQAQVDTARVQQYRIANNLPSMSGASLTEQEISTYNQETATARAQAAEDAARLATARSQLRAGSTGDDVGEALGSSVVSELRGKRSEVSGRLAALEVQFGPLYPDVKKARSELQDIDAQIAAEIKRVISNLEAKVQVSSGRLGSIRGSLGGAQERLSSNNRAMVGLDDLTRRAEASQQLYDSYLAQYKQTLASQGTERPEARVISYADLPQGPVSPKPLLNMLLALVIGLGVGVVIALIREMLFSGLSTSSDVENRLNVRCLGTVPSLASILPGAASPLVAIAQMPQSGFSEAFRGLRTSLRYAPAGSPQVLMITSALPREGKTTISACLTQIAAQGGERVVLVDVDPRQRGASRLVHEATGPDLLDVLRGTASVDEALIQDPQSGAWILPIRDASNDIGDLLIGDAMIALIAALRQRFGLVVLDAAPVLPIADTRALAAMVDGVVMIVRWRTTADHAVRTALRLLPLDRVPLAGIVLSQVDIRKQAQYGYGDSAHYYASYKHYYT